MHHLVIDIGNTNSKIAVFKMRELIHFESVHHLDQSRIAEIIRDYGISHSAVSSVSDEHKGLISFLKINTQYTEFSVRIQMGIKNNYGTGTTLGLDRWAKVIAAHRLYPGQDCFMIDCGTCITYDLLNRKQEYDGGSISLGLNMRFQALAHFTGRLPLVKWDKEILRIPAGSNTNNAILNGVLQGAVYEVDGFIAHQYANNNKVRIMITGGDAPFLMEQLKDRSYGHSLIHEPYLVLKGLNEAIAFEQHVQKN